MTVSGLPLETATRCRYRAYGVELACEFPLAGGIPAPGTGPAAQLVTARAQPRRQVEALWSGSGEPLHRALLGAATPLAVERGEQGDHLVRHGEHLFHLSADLAVLSCTPPALADAGWEQALLDWAAYSVAALTGTPCLHAAAVATAAGGVAVAAAGGGGKSTLAAELVAAGAGFVADDVLALAAGEGIVSAHPGAPFARLDRGSRDLAEQLGAPRGAVGDELWVAVRDPATEPVPVTAIVILDRRREGPALPRLEPAGFFDLRALAIGFGAAAPERRRFELLAALAEQAPPLRLLANSATPPEMLAAAVLDELGPGGRRC